MATQIPLVDPIGPGSKAWAYADKAIDAWQDYAASNESSRGKLSKRYSNHRTRMIAALRANKVNEAEIQAWCAQLDVSKNLLT